MSDFAEVCDFLLADLEENVAQCRGAILHRYAPWDPERFVAQENERHVAVWPTSDLETVAPLTTLAHELTQNYVIAYWESAGDEAERQVVDEQAAADLFDTHNAIRARLYDLSNQVIGTAPNSTYKVWYQGAAVNDAASTTRWVVLSVEVHRAKEFA